MWTRSKSENGKFEYSLYSMTGEHIGTVGGFATAQEADRAAEVAQRVDLFGDKAPMSLGQMLDSMNDEELLRELLG